MRAIDIKKNKSFDKKEKRGDIRAKTQVGEARIMRKEKRRKHRCSLVIQQHNHGKPALYTPAKKKRGKTSIGKGEEEETRSTR